MINNQQSGNANVCATDTSVVASGIVTLPVINQGENNMAEVDTNYLADQHSDIRREAVQHTNEIIKEGLKEAYNVTNAVKDSRYEVVNTIGTETDRIAKDISDFRMSTGDRFFTVARDTQDIRAQIVAQQQQLVAGFASAAKDAEINALKTQAVVMSDGDKTRALINDLKNTDLNRMLIERNAEIVEERHAARHWRGNFDQSQWAGLNSQLQAFQSQLQETRQGMVNFGTMAGVGQTSTSNNVR